MSAKNVRQCEKEPRKIAASTNLGNKSVRFSDDALVKI